MASNGSSRPAAGNSLLYSSSGLSSAGGYSRELLEYITFEGGPGGYNPCRPLVDGKSVELVRMGGSEVNIDPLVDLTDDNG